MNIEHVGPKILAKIKIYILTRAELLFNLCYEIPCTYLCDIYVPNYSSCLEFQILDFFLLWY